MEAEAKLIANYLVKNSDSPENIAHYLKAVEALNIKYSPNEERIMKLVMKFPFLIGFVDAGLAIIDKQSNLRYRIYTMLAILETDPALSKYFLAKNFTLLEWMITILAGARSVIRIVFGFIILKVLRYE
jgi:hypothetical protein